MAAYPALDQRPLKDTICLFDVDETLTKARSVCAFPAPPVPLPRIAVAMRQSFAEQSTPANFLPLRALRMSN